jgi:tmRNA-binding protein
MDWIEKKEIKRVRRQMYRQQRDLISLLLFIRNKGCKLKVINIMRVFLLMSEATDF